MILVHTPREHARIVAQAVVGACRLGGWTSPVQPQLLHTLFNRLLGQDLDFLTLPPLAPIDVAAALTAQSARHELIQLMTVIEILSNPLSPEVEQSVTRWAGRFTCTSVRSRTPVISRAARWRKPCTISTG